MLFTMHCLFISKVNYRKFSCEMWWNIENNIFFWSVFVVLTSYHWVQSVRCEKCLRKWPRNKQQFLHGREHFIILVPWAHRLISSSFYEKLYLYEDISGTWHIVFSINLIVCSVEEGYFEYGNFETCYFEFEIKLFRKKKTKMG